MTRSGVRQPHDWPVIARLGRRLLFRFAPPPGAGPEPDAVLVVDSPEPATSALPLIEFVAYGEDCLLSGRLRLAADRLTDMLNGHDEFELVDVLVEPLDGRSSAEVLKVVVMREEIVMVHASGPRGSPERRHRTRPHPVALQLGTYEARGNLHALPGTDPMIGLRRRQVMVPLTDASIDFRIGGTWHRRDVGTLLVNRDRIDWVVAAPLES